MNLPTTRIEPPEIPGATIPRRYLAPVAIFAALFTAVAVGQFGPFMGAAVVLGVFFLLCYFNWPMVTLCFLFFTLFLSPVLMDRGFVPPIRGLHPTNAIIGLTGLAMVARKLIVEKALIWRSSSLDLPFLAMLAMFGMGLVVAPLANDPTTAAASQSYGIRAIIPLLVFYIVSQTLITPRQARIALLALLLVIFAFCVYGVLQHFQMKQFLAFAFSYVGRSKGVFGYPKPFSMLSMTGALIAWSLFLSTADRRKRRFYLVVTGVCTLGLLYSYARAGYLGLAAGLFLLCWFRDRRWLWLFVLALVTFPIWAPQTVIDRILFTFFSYGDVAAIDESSSMRFIIWPGALEAITMRPWFGWGNESLISFNWVRFFPETTMAYDAHQIFFNIAVDFGAVGLVLFLYFAFCLLKEGWLLYRAGRRWERPFETALGLAFVATVAGAFISNIAHSVLFSGPEMPYLYGFAAITARARRILHDETRANPATEMVTPP